MRHEGLLVGGSSGSALSGALRWLHSDEGRAIAQTEGANVVVLLPDGYVPACLSVVRMTNVLVSSVSIRNYMSKPWFLKMALEAEPTPLAHRIAEVLKTSKSDVQTNGAASK